MLLVLASYVKFMWIILITCMNESNKLIKYVAS